MGESHTEVDGFVVDDRGVPLSGVTVVYRPEGIQKDLDLFTDVQTTEDKGWFIFARTHRPLRGRLIVEATKEGYQKATITVEMGTINPGRRIVLRRAGGDPAQTPEKSQPLSEDRYAPKKQ
jgi:hypothetical protein